MIWINQNESELSAETTPLAEHIWSELSAADALPAAADAADRDRCAAAVEAVTAFWRVHCGADVAVRTELLLLTTARALWAAGARAAAERLLAAGAAVCDLPEQCRRLVFAEQVALADWAPFFIARTMTPRAFASLHDKLVWVLNVPRLLGAAHAGLELYAWRVMQTALERLAVVFDLTGGRGALGLRGLLPASAAILGKPRQARPCRRLADEWLCCCRASLAGAAARRLWLNAPTVVALDLY